MNFINSDSWRKQAALTATSDADIEKAFADMASGFVENKIPALMKGNHNIGFEIVKKNDENTRMVGIFAFKINRSLIFAPVFFLNGEIKGPLLYRCDTKTFVPATKEWAAYLVSALESEEGKAVSKDERKKSMPLVRMERINMRPGRSKAASAVKEVIDTPVKWHKGDPTPTPNSNCVIVFEDEYNPKEVNWGKECPCGCTSIKIASWDDGTFTCHVPGVDAFHMDHNAGIAFAAAGNGQSVAIDGPGGYQFEIPATGVAQIKKAFFDKSATTTDWGAVSDAMNWAIQPQGLIRDMMHEEDYGKTVAEAVTKAASADYNFAEMLATIYGSPENMIPKSFAISEKRASVLDPGEVGFVNKIDVFTKSATPVPPEFFDDGFFMYDSRPDSAKSVTVVRQDNALLSANTPGIYSVLLRDGSFEDNVIILHDGNGGHDREHFVVRRRYSPFWDSTMDKNTMLLIKDGKITRGDQIIGKQTEELSSAKFEDTVQKGKLYVVVVNNTGYGPYMIIDSDEKDGVKFLKVKSVSPHYCNDSSRHFVHSSAERVILNKDTETRISKGVWGKDAKFIPISSEVTESRHSERGDDPWKEDSYGDLKIGKIENLATNADISDFIFGRFHAHKVVVEKQHTREDGVKFRMNVDGHNLAPMGKKAAMKALAVDLRIDGPQVYEFLKKADAENVVEFYIEPHEKIASRLRLIDHPMFDEDMDDTHGISIQPIQTFKLDTHGDQLFEAPSSVGDMWNPTSLTGLPDSTVLSSDPGELRALADTYKLPNVFEHGVIGTLANAFNAISLVDKYVAKLEDGVDALGRLKFLIHWSPQDFEKAYGSDSMVNMEAQVDENFKSLGDLLLDLLKKTERQRKGETDQFKEK